MANQLTRYATVATVDTADQGYVCAPSVIIPRLVNAVLVTGVDQVRAFQFVLPFRITVRRILTDITTGGGAGKLFACGMYDVSGNLLFQIQEKDANDTGGLASSVTAITLEPGTYTWAWTSDSTTTQSRTMDVANGFGNWFGLLSTKTHGTATAAAAPGILNNTLGTITNATFQPMAAVLTS